MTFGFSRDDAGKFLEAYYDTKIFENDPFARLDQTGVGKLMEMTIKLGKPVNPALHIGICGEHGGDPTSIEFCNRIGLDYVSCSPFRVPIARLAAAQAAIAQKAEKDSCGGERCGCKADEAKESAKEFTDKAVEVAKEVAQTVVEASVEVAKVGKDVAKAGLAGVKAGLDEAKRAYNENKK
jgi:pyruvate,orthophosphate dikinase